MYSAFLLRVDVDAFEAIDGAFDSLLDRLVKDMVSTFDLVSVMGSMSLSGGNPASEERFELEVGAFAAASLACICPIAVKKSMRNFNVSWSMFTRRGFTDIFRSHSSL